MHTTLLGRKHLVSPRHSLSHTAIARIRLSYSSHSVELKEERKERRTDRVEKSGQFLCNIGSSALDLIETMELTRQIVAAVATMMIVGSLFVVLHDTPRASSGSSAPTQLFNDLGNEYVEGYSCHGLTQNAPCSPIGGECEGFISQSCACKSEYSGYPCDWGPKVADPITSYSNSPPMNKTEELQRIAMAYGFANAIYKEEDQMTTACPGFADDDAQAVGTSQIHLISNGASTHAGASLILPGSRSPSGRGEAIFGFRGSILCAASFVE